MLTIPASAVITLSPIISFLIFIVISKIFSHYVLHHPEIYCTAARDIFFFPQVSDVLGVNTNSSAHPISSIRFSCATHPSMRRVLDGPAVVPLI